MSNTQIRTNYDRLSSIYDYLAKPERKYIKLALQALEIKPGQHILEIGYGTGLTLTEMASCIGDTGRVSGIDLSTGMAQFARQKIHKAGVSALVNVGLGDAVRLPFKNTSFDVVFLSFTLELFNETGIVNVLKECRRVLIPGSRLCVIGLVKTANYGWAIRLYEWGHDQFPQFIDCQPAPLQQHLTKAGFSIFEVKPFSMWGLPVEIILACK